MLLLILFLLLTAAYAAVYGIFCIKKGRIGPGAGALSLIPLPGACVYVFIRYLMR